MSAKALVEIRDVIHVLVEFRAPKKGELMWRVPEYLTPAEAVDHVVCGRDVWRVGESGFGFFASRDMPEIEVEDDDDGLGDLRYRNLVVHVEYVRTEPDPHNVLPHVRLL